MTRRYQITLCERTSQPPWDCGCPGCEYGGEVVEMVSAQDYDDAVKLAAAAIEALPERSRELVIEAMKARVA